MAFIRHFIRVPKLPSEVRDQFNAIEIVEYLAPEKSSIAEGQPVVRVKTWWALLDVVSTVRGRVEKNLYDSLMLKGTRLEVGEPLSLILSDVDDMVGFDSGHYYELKTVQVLREKPKKNGGD